MNEFAAFMRSRIIEIALLTVASAALFSTVTYGFHIDGELRASWPAIVGLPLLLNVYFASISYTPRSAVVGSVAFVVAYGLLSAAVSAACGHAFFYDEYGNIGFYILLGTITTLVGYVMTRRKTLVFAYAIGGCFTCALVQFLYVNALVVQDIVFLLAAISLCVVCTNRMQSNRIAADDVPPWQYLACGLGVSALAVALATAVFFLVVVPINPPAHELKLVTKYYALETVHVRGEQRVEHQEDDSLVSNDQVDGDRQTNLENDQTEEVSGGKSGAAGDDDPGGDSFGSQSFNTSVFGESTEAIDYFHELSRLLFAVPALVLAVVAAVLAKIALRKRRYRKMRALPAGESIVAFYRFFNDRFGKLGIRRAEGATPFEFARNASSTTSLLENGAEGSTFMQLTEAYCGCVYGNADPHEDDLDCCANLYGVFYRNARHLIGPAGYAKRFFRL